MATNYKLYILNSKGKIAAAADAVAGKTDEEAVAWSRRKHANCTCELWEGVRLVAVIRNDRSLA